MGRDTVVGTTKDVMITWHERFETGVELVDAQHRILIENVNRLESLLDRTVPTRETCDPLLGFLESYVSAHFLCEEECMERLRCPVHEQNKRAHAELLDYYREFKRKYAAEGPNPGLLRQLQTTLSNWIVSHIMKVDSSLKAVA